MADSKTQQRWYNKSLERALQILCSFRDFQRPASLTEIVRAVAVPKSTSRRLCSTLVEYGFLQLNSETKEYSLGPMFFELGGTLVESFSVTRVAAPHLDALQRSVQQTVWIDVLRDDYLIHIDKWEDPSSPIRFGLQVGMRRPPHYGASGQVLSAYLPDEELDRLLRKFPLARLTAKTIVDEKQYKLKLGEIRRRGYALDEGETVELVSAVATPIRDRAGKVIAAMGVGYISHSLSMEQTMKIVDEAVNTARAVSQSMGYPAEGPVAD